MTNDLNNTKEAFVRLGLLFENLVNNPDDDKEFLEVAVKARQTNPWFTENNIAFAFKVWADTLQRKKLDKWLEKYNTSISGNKMRKRIGVVNAGNIPLVGFHDFLCTLISGNHYVGKNSSDDPYLLPFVAEKLIAINPAFKTNISFVNKLQQFDKVIATGSNNTARYFEYYFEKYPHVIRKNRNGVAILNGEETEHQLAALGEDIFRYYGLGCRNVSHLLVPVDYDFSRFFRAMEQYKEVVQHHKYMNNYEYYRAILLLKKVPFLDNGFLILKEDALIPSAISILHFSYYGDQQEVSKWLSENAEMIQCTLSAEMIPFGQSQYPSLSDYADGVDTMEFLLAN